MEETNTAKHYNGPGNFPERLHYVLEEMARDHQERIMCWDEIGSGFKVHDREQLEAEILPTYFRQTKYTSFQRQLNIYGFTRVNTGPRKGTYCHDLFVRNMPELAQQIPRKDNKKSSHSQAKCDYRHLDLITPQDVSYHENQEYSPHRVPAELIRNCQSVPLDLSMSTIHRSTHNPVSPCTQGPFPMSLSNPGGSSLGSIRALPVGSHHFVSHNSFLGHEAINGILHGTGNPSTKSQEIIKRALSLIQSNNNLGH